jgi:hypothetical protein
VGVAAKKLALLGRELGTQIGERREFSSEAHQVPAQMASEGHVSSHRTDIP